MTNRRRLGYHGMKLSPLRSPERRFAFLSTMVWLVPAGLSWSCSSPSSAPGGASGSTAAGGATTGGGATTSGGVSTGGTTNGGSSAGGATTGGAATTGGVTMTSGGSTSGGALASGGTGGGSPSLGGSTQAGSAGAPSTGGSGQAGATGAACPTMEETKFSFFLISYKALQRESGSPDGFGGDLGGITGADGICQRIAEYVSPCQKNKVWHAFLSTTKVNALDRIGKGPWYDRLGRKFADNLTGVVKERPDGIDPAIKDSFPNEDGVDNHNPDGTGKVDNHEILTGTGLDGKLYTQSTTAGGKGSATSCGDGQWSPEAATCWDWTSKEPKGCPRVGHSWIAASGNNWMSVWNEGGCAPGGNFNAGGLDGTRKVGSAGGYGGYYCFAVTGQ